MQGMQAVAQRQAEILSQAMNEVSSVAQQLASAGSNPQEMTTNRPNWPVKAFGKRWPTCANWPRWSASPTPRRSPSSTSVSRKPAGTEEPGDPLPPSKARLLAFYAGGQAMRSFRDGLSARYFRPSLMTLDNKRG